MTGIIVNYNGEETKVAVKDGMITVNLFANNGDSPALADGESRMYIGGIDYEECKRYVWRDYFPIKIGDRVNIKVAEIETFSAPAKVAEDKNMKRPKTKLDFFRELEAELKKQGLI
jgi:hypothetical protein